MVRARGGVSNTESVGKLIRGCGLSLQILAWEIEAVVDSDSVPGPKVSLIVERLGLLIREWEWLSERMWNTLPWTRN